MTCIVAYKKNNIIYMGADSAGSNGHNTFARKDSKLFIKNNMIFGFTSSFRMGNLLKYKLEIPKHKSNISVDTYMNTLFIDEVIKCFEDGAYTKNTNNVIQGGIFLVGYKNRIFKIESDFQVGEKLIPFDSCGSGEELAIGAMDALLQYDKNIKPEKLLTLALTSASKYTTSVDKPFKFLKLENK